MLRKLFAILFFSTIVAGQVSANDDQTDNELFVEVQVTAYAAKHSGDNLLGKNLYVEKSVNKDGLSVFGVVYHDEEFHEAQVGLAKKITDELQVGLGVGAAVYDGKTHGVVSPWAYYDKDTIRALVTAEAYSSGSKPFVKAWIQKDITETVYVGVYYENSIGAGPLVGVKVSDNVKISAAVTTNGTALIVLAATF